MEYSKTIFDICVNCALFNSGGAFAAYAILVFILGWLAPREHKKLTSNGNNEIPPLMIGDMGVVGLARIDRPSHFARLLFLLASIFKIESFLKIIDKSLCAIRYCLGFDGSKFDSIRALHRITIFYFVIIPLPAAFMTPINHTQIKPDSHLLTALLLLIAVNALGDFISAKITIANFSRALKKSNELRNKSDLEKNSSLKVFFAEMHIYIATIRDLLFSIAILILVLALSNILFGIQIGEYRFEFDSNTLGKMLDRALRFPELVNEMYWFKGDLEGLDQNDGIPGMFLYGISTFIPTIMMLILVLFWLVITPIRVAIYLPKNKFYKILTAEFFVIFSCLIVTTIIGMNFIDVLGAIITTF